MMRKHGDLCLVFIFSMTSVVFTLNINLMTSAVFGLDIDTSLNIHSCKFFTISNMK